MDWEVLDQEKLHKRHLQAGLKDAKKNLEKDFRLEVHPLVRGDETRAVWPKRRCLCLKKEDALLWYKPSGGLIILTLAVFFQNN